MGLTRDTSSHNDGHLWQLIWKSFNAYESYGPDKKVWTDTLTHSHCGDYDELTTSGLDKNE